MDTENVVLSGLTLISEESTRRLKELVASSSERLSIIVVGL